jgi:hypothetical protein
MNATLRKNKNTIQRRCYLISIMLDDRFGPFAYRAPVLQWNQ